MAASYIRRFLFDPGVNVLLNIESVNILDLTPPGAIAGIGTGTVLIVGEFENGPFNTPTQVSSASDLASSWGILGYTYGGVQGNYPCAVQRYQDNAVSPENWNGNAFVQLNGKQFGALIVCRVNTSVGNIQFSNLAFITGATNFRYFLANNDVLGLDVGAGAQTATFTATAASLLSVTATYAVNNGDTVTLGYDGAPNFTVTFLTGDNNQANVIARINQYAGFAFAATSSGQYTLTGIQKGNQAQVRVVGSSSPGVLTALGIAVGTTFGTGNVANIQAVTPTEVQSVVQAAVANTSVQLDPNGALRISKTTGLAQDYVQVTAATTTNVQASLGFVPGQFAANNGVGFLLSGTFGTSVSGTFQMAVDDNLGSRSTVNGGQPFTVTTTAAMTLAALVAAINAAAGTTVAYADSTTGFSLVGKTPGGRINILGASVGTVLSTIGLAVGISTGPGLPLGTIPAGTVVQDASAAHVFVTMQDVVFASTGVTIGGLPVSSATGPWLVPIRHAVDNTLGTSAGGGTVTTVLNPPLLFSVSCINPQATTAALTDAQIDAAYVTALVATTDVNSIAKTTNIVYSARQSNTVRSNLRTNALNASANGCFGRMAIVRPPLGTTKVTAQSTAAQPGVGSYRDQRVIYTWPQLNTFVPIIGARGTAGGTGYTYNGNVDVGADGFLASIMSQLPPEENPGQTTPFTSAVNGLESSPNAAGLVMQDYINLKAAGICAPRMDSGVCLFQSGCTSVDPNVYPSLVRISRRRMADFIQDSLALLASGFGKKLSTNSRRKSLVNEIIAFMEALLNKGNPNGQRIAGYTVDATTGNTPTNLALGLFRIIINVRTLPSLDSIVLQTTIGEQVQVQEVFPQAA